MISKNQKTLNKLNAITAGVIVFISYLLSGWLWLVIIRDTPNNVALINSIHDTTLYVAVAYAFFTVLLLNFLKVYHTSRVHRETWKYGMVLIGNTISMLAVGFSLYLFRVEDFSRGTLFLCYISSCLLMMGKRVIVYLILRHFRSKGYNKKHIIVVGGGHLAEQYIKCAAAEPNLGLQIDDHLIPSNNKKCWRILRLNFTARELTR